MEQAKLPQPYALRMELIRSKGYSDLEVISFIERGNGEELKSHVDPELNWGDFLEYARENFRKLKTAILEGYQFNFITAGGIQNLLRIRFSLQLEQDYRFDGVTFEGLRLKSQDYQLLRSLVPEHWSFFDVRRDESAGDIGFGIKLQSGN
ncbi:hypothetical protein DFP94_11665 [Fontibacillus phaseoli]|uniref:Uncharacterized protein n=1 Tax=Fontibacillus phaseoli TaxID=1416533 RepID=A0A369B390_9BACL|nr:hypothetical protein [Fontibacillus phaseoli]RCX14926.1 hypothetical protein DFP94_11665 [Fontibacillus phaseoli]